MRMVGAFLAAREFGYPMELQLCIQDATFAGLLAFFVAVFIYTCIYIYDMLDIHVKNENDNNIHDEFTYNVLWFFLPSLS